MVRPVAPVETPADVIGRLAAAMPQVFASPSYQARPRKLGLEQFALDPEQSAAFIKAEFDKWAAVAKSANIQWSRTCRPSASSGAGSLD